MTNSTCTAIDIVPFALPNCPDNEIRWEEPRDISRVVVTFASAPTQPVSLHYQRANWPQRRAEKDYLGINNAMPYGWCAIDDWFNTPWVQAVVDITEVPPLTYEITFRPLNEELSGCEDYNVDFRRTLGIKITADAIVDHAEVYTRYETHQLNLDIELDCGGTTASRITGVQGYNAVVHSLETENQSRIWHVDAHYLQPDIHLAGDESHLLVEMEHDRFTISLSALISQGSIWYAHEHIYIKLADDPTDFAAYLQRHRNDTTINQKVMALPDHELGGALFGQPRAHPVSNSIGCAYARQRFWVEYNGDIVLTKANIELMTMNDTHRFLNKRDGRLFMNLERWRSLARYADPSPVPAQNLHFCSQGVICEQKCYAVPLNKEINTDLAGDETIIAMIRLRFRNDGLQQADIHLPLEYSSDSEKSSNRFGHQPGDRTASGYLVPNSARDTLYVERTDRCAKVFGEYDSQRPLRFVVDTVMQVHESQQGIVLQGSLAPGEVVDAIIKLPFISLDTADEHTMLENIDYDTAYQQVRSFWNQCFADGAQVFTPEVRLNELHAMHPIHIATADVAMGDDTGLINTSVGTSTYGNFTNESVMIIQELDERGLHDEARRRIEAWLKYQGQLGLQGNFSDHDGVFYAAGGFEMGQTYSQHHGWALWSMAEHYFMTRDSDWFMKISPQLLEAAEWVFRQRSLTKCQLPHSRGWEYGFMPAASLEDVADYFYWLTTNTMSWKGVDRLAEALERCGHPDAGRIRAEADAFKHDLLRGFDIARQHSPIVKLRDGRWVPHYPSRLYARGRSDGWIREVLEGSVYLPMMGLFEPSSQQAGWILDDYHDNRYISDDYGYPIYQPERYWYDNGGFSCQPNLLAGLLPHLDRDEIETYIWMFFNAWAACYREETNALVEHPMPILGQSNSAWIKTSDQANTQRWLRNMFVYAPKDVLYIGRAIPREWLKSTTPIGVKSVCTQYGQVDALYTAQVDGKLRLELDLRLSSQPGRVIARFRHPSGSMLRETTANGHRCTILDAAKGDVEITEHDGKVTVEACYD